MRTPSRPGMRGRLAAAVTAGLTTLPIAACAGPAPRTSPDHPPAPPSSSPSATSSLAPQPSRTPHGGLPDPRTLDQTDATALSRATLTIMWTVDTAIDNGQLDAYLRAIPYLTPDFAAKVRSERSQSTSILWMKHRAYSRVRLEPIPREQGAPRDTATEAFRQWAITVTPTGRDGWTGTAVHAIAFVALERPHASAPWKVAHVSTSDP